MHRLRHYLPSWKESGEFLLFALLVGGVIFGVIELTRVSGLRPSKAPDPIQRSYPSPAPELPRANPVVVHPLSQPPPAQELSVRAIIPPVQTSFPFHTMEMAGLNPDGNPAYISVGRNGTERLLPLADRGWIISEHQSDYRAPETGCGVTAVLDWFVWYQAIGLVPKYSRDADFGTFKRKCFDLIDRDIRLLRGRNRTVKDPANTNELIVAFDDIVSRLSEGRLRLGFSISQSPLGLKTILEQTHGVRAGILVVQVFDGKAPRQNWGSFHAVVLVRTDSTGRVSIGNWGKYEHGRLVSRTDGQWFVPENGAAPIFRVGSLITLIPFSPSG